MVFLKLPILARILFVLLVFVLLVVAAWVLRAGWQTVYRIIRYGDTKIDDFKHYPYRSMAASPQPYALVEAPDRQTVDLTVPFPPGESSSLDTLLEENNTIALLVLKDDRLVLERYYQGHSAAAHSQSFSMAKSFSSALVGLAIEDGLVQSVDQPVTDFIPELKAHGFEGVSLQHLLTMTSGSSYVENDNPFGIHVILNYTPDLEDRILSFRMADPPGSTWRYKSGDNALLALALSRALAPKTITEYMEERVWAPLGMEAQGLWSLDHEEDGLEKTWCCLAATARDFLKLGRLYLNNGMWEGRQVIPAEWVYASTQVGRIPADAWDAGYRQIGIYNYGYQWWLVSQEEGSYLANGKDGQLLYINPAKNVVILRLGWGMGKLPLSQWQKLFKQLEGGW